MRAILIDPRERTVEEIQFEGDYRQIQKILSYPEDTHFCFTAISITDDEACYVDDEGLLKVGREKFVWKNYPHKIAGKGLILGTDDEGDSIGTKLDLEMIRGLISWTDEVTDGTPPGPPLVFSW